MKAQTMTLRSLLLLAPVMTVILTAPAFGSTLLFQVSGTASSDGRPENASAMFTINATSIDIVLENLAGPGQLGGISSVLDGLAFMLVGGSPTGLTLQPGATAAGYLDCTAGTVTCSPGTAPPGVDFGWTLTGTSTYLLTAGGGSFKPGGVVNNNITGDTDGIKNPQHNNYLLGPVTFTVGFSGDAPTGIGLVDFYFGTVPDILHDPVAVPEPGTLFPLATALGVAGIFAWRRRKAGCGTAV